TNEYPEKNKQAVKHDIGDLAEHADTHGRNLTALGHILCVKTHDDIPKKKKSVGLIINDEKINNR
ncbi:hypothetical protein AB2K52_003609, partial [Escherichia coli]